MSLLVLQVQVQDMQEVNALMVVRICFQIIQIIFEWLVFPVTINSLIIKGTRTAFPSALLVGAVDMLDKSAKLSAHMNSSRTNCFLTLSKS